MKDLMLQRPAKRVASASRKPAEDLPNNKGGTMVTPPRNGDCESFRKIEQSITYMQEHLDRPLQVATLAALVNVSPSHYFALFKRWTGSAPIDYFGRLRMRKACALLDTTEFSVTEVATALGYEDPFYFSRVFKSVVGVSPSRYRMFHRNGKEGPAGKTQLQSAARINGVGAKLNGWNGNGHSPQRSPAEMAVDSRITARALRA